MHLFLDMSMGTSPVSISGTSTVKSQHTVSKYILESRKKLRQLGSLLLSEFAEDLSNKSSRCTGTS